MSASDEWTQWHLTPRGWECGTRKWDFGREDREPPSDRVLTMVYREFVGFSSMSKSLDVEWESSDPGAIRSVKEKFGATPRDLS